MKEYLKSISNELKNYSKSLDKTSILINKPWAVIDEELQLQKLIFKKDKALIMSMNGQVSEGRWDYFPEAKSLLIDRGSDKILCNEVFINEGIIILKLDGTQKEVFALANENLIPDLNILNYIENWKKVNLINDNLSNNKDISIKSIDHHKKLQAGYSSEGTSIKNPVVLFLAIAAFLILILLMLASS